MENVGARQRERKKKQKNTGAVRNKERGARRKRWREEK
jgi:hypothetical protein